MAYLMPPPTSHYESKKKLTPRLTRTRAELKVTCSQERVHIIPLVMHSSLAETKVTNTYIKKIIKCISYMALGFCNKFFIACSK